MSYGWVWVWGANGNFRDRIKEYMLSLSFLVADFPVSFMQKGRRRESNQKYNQKG